MTSEQEAVLADILGKPKEFVIAHPEIKLNKAQQARFNLASRKLKSGWPLAYVLGYKWFCGCRFEVNRSVLIPRPETEQLVDLAARMIKDKRVKMVIDIGTGSGAIIVSLANSKGPVFYASDISARALAVAKKNARRIATDKIIFKKGSLLSPFKSIAGANNVLITANLPYISKKELKEPSIKFEPKLALYGGKKSHFKIEQLLKQLSELGLKKSYLILEINWDQEKILKQKIKKYLPNASIKVHKDFNNYSRFLELQFGF